MEKEEITISLYYRYYEINVKFYFRNYGESETVEVGFPQWKHHQPTEDDFYSFSCKVNGDESPYRVIEPVEPEELNDYLLVTKWYVRSVDFPADEITTTEVTFSGPYGVFGISESVDYLFGTGATWKDCIGEMDIVINNYSEDIWINKVAIDNEWVNDIWREGNSIVCKRWNVVPNFDSQISLEIDSVPNCLVSLRRIDPERDWYFRKNDILPQTLICYTDAQLRLLRNLLFAAYGNIFASQDINDWLQKYCSEWYRPTAKVYQDIFTEKELQNLELIQAEEARRK